MRLKTSFFDWTVFRKDIVRFAPLWGLYFIGGMLVMMTLCLPFGTVAKNPGATTASSVGGTIIAFSSVNLVYAALAAQLLFGDLYKPQLCNALHAMPMRRETWFLSHVLAGLSVSVIPHVVVMLFLAPAMGEYWFVALYWLLGMTLQYLFFFGLAVLCAFCAGNRIAAVAMYSIVNFASPIVMWFCKTFVTPKLYGVEVAEENFRLWYPVEQIGQLTELLKWEYDGFENDYYKYYRGLGEGWGYLAVIGIIGVVLLVVSLFLYRRRKLECAGEFIAVKPLGPVFGVVFALFVGALLAMCKGPFLRDEPFLILGIVIGWYVAQMLLQRTVKIFRIEAFLTAGALVALVFVSVMLIRWDVFGVVEWMPATDSVQSVTVTEGTPKGDYVGNLEKETVTLTSVEDIKNIRKAHKDILARREENVVDGHTVELIYKLKNGLTVRRWYWAPANGRNQQMLDKIFPAPSR